MPPKPAAKVVAHAKLPRLNHTLLEAMEALVVEISGSKRPPVFKASILALAVELNKNGEPWPSRHAVAAHVGCSVWGVDNAVNSLIAQGLIIEKIKHVPGNIEQRENVIKLKHYVPTRVCTSALPAPRIVATG